MKLSRKTIEQGLNDLPMSAILGKTVSDALTPSQREFARKVAQGKRKVTAYKEAYPNATSPNTLSREPYMLSRDPRIIKEIEAYTLAIEAEKHRTPAALRSLVIKGLVEIALKDDTKDAVRLQALKTIGQITEVHAFTEHRETKVITSSEDARAKVMAELRGILTAQASDATIIEADADSLLRELSVNINGADNINGDRDAPININADPTAETAEPSTETPPHPDPPIV
jgi:hypothetical protein